MSKNHIVVTSNYGRVIGCHHCKSLETVNYKVHYPPFASAIDSIKFAWCENHEKEVIDAYNKAEGSSDRLKQADSNS